MRQLRETFSRPLQLCSLLITNNPYIYTAINSRNSPASASYLFIVFHTSNKTLT